jgi:hypothetical protein
MLTCLPICPNDPDVAFIGNVIFGTRLNPNRMLTTVVGVGVITLFTCVASTFRNSR